MSKFELLARRLVLFLGLVGGCGVGDRGANGPTYGASEPPSQAAAAALMTTAVADMDRLRGLGVVTVDQLVLNADEAHACYGGAPCPGSESSPAVATELARQVPRLTRLTDIGARLAAATEVAPADPAGVSADLAALQSLGVVQIGDLLTVAPANNANCYSLPCPEDIARAGAENQRRAGIVHAWSAEAAAVDSGL